MKVLVYGLARSGQAAGARLAARGDEVVAVDRTLGNEDELGLLDGAGLLVKSPGVPGDRPLAAAARARGIPVWSELELGWRLLAPAGTRFVAVTGTNGKSTTSELIGAALIGATIGFLWFNSFPAEVFMGDTGAMALGGAIGAMAIFLKVEILLLFIGGVYLIEALSVIIQVFTFKYLGRRVFLIAPIHHHFEMKAWSETKIMVRFWIIAGILCAIGFGLFYRYYLNFRA